MHRCISIWYDDQTADNGEPIDLFSYLENELNNAGIIAEMIERKDPCDGSKRTRKCAEGCEHCNPSETEG